MAHFAELDENNQVIRVIVVHNNELMVDGVESEAKGIEFVKSLLGQDTRWVQTSYNANFRKNYAGEGYTYDQDLDAFIPPKPFASWMLNTDTCRWEAPVPFPNDNIGQGYDPDYVYYWDEDSVSWATMPRNPL